MEVCVKIASTLVCAGLFFAGSSAVADTTAVYKPKSKTIPVTMTVEISDNGNSRYQMSTGRAYGLELGGVDYVVDLGASRPVVDRADDLFTAQKEAMAAFMPAFRQHDTTAGPHLVPLGKVKINGRAGQAFGYEVGTKVTTGVVINDNPGSIQVGKSTRELAQSAIQSPTGSPVIVISDDPELAPLAKVMANEFGKSFAMLSGVIGDPPEMVKEMQTILGQGAPLAFAGMELQFVSHARIDPRRFELPAPPETLDQIRHKMKPLEPPPTAPQGNP